MSAFDDYLKNEFAYNAMMLRHDCQRDRRSYAASHGCARWWSEGWQRLMDIAAREYDERALPYRGQTDYIYERTMRAHERYGNNDQADSRHD